MKNKQFLLFLSMISLNTIYGQGSSINPISTTNTSQCTFGGLSGAVEMIQDDNTGNIGIGLATPNANLHLSSFGNGTRLYLTGNTTTPSASLSVQQIDNTTATIYENNQVTGNHLLTSRTDLLVNSLWVTRVDANYEYNHTQYSDDAPSLRSSTTTTDFIVKATGNTGVGTYDPTAHLHIYGSPDGATLLKVDNGSPAMYVTATGRTGIGTATPAYLLDVAGDANIKNTLNVGSSSNAGFVKVVGGSSTQAALDVQGNVRIGNVTTPAGYGLYVEQGVLAEKFKCALKATSDWSDYVFEKNYHLATLSEVDAFIQVHKHLPDVPSAEDVVCKGIDMAKMDATLLRKIEELTLYVIDLKQENQGMKAEIANLKK